VLLVGLGLCFIAIATAGVWGSPTRGFREGWGCEPERIGFTSTSLEEGGGSSDQLEAVRDVLPSLAEDGEVPLEQLERAVDRRSGPSRFGPGTGQLWIDGLIHAEIHVSQLMDGTWVAGSYEQCMKDPAS
jgi:hypothetical protein